MPLGPKGEKRPADVMTVHRLVFEPMPLTLRSVVAPPSSTF
jgi:hypothetical protein